MNSTSSSSQQPLWNSLEVAKLLTSLLFPLAIASVGFFLDARIKNTEERRLREKSVNELKEILSDYNNILSSTYFQIADPDKKIDFTEAKESLLKLRNAERNYRQLIDRVKYQILRDVFSNNEKTIEQFWKPSEKAFSTTKNCLSLGLKAAELQLTSTPQDVMWKCFLKGQSLAENKLFGPVSIPQACARNLIEAANIASLDISVSFKKLDKQVRASVEDFVECHE